MMDKYTTLPQRCVVIENVRSSYNVGNIIRTADALGYGVILSWYSPSPFKDIKVQKSSLWAENNVPIVEEWNTSQVISSLQHLGWYIVAAELTDTSIALSDFVRMYTNLLSQKIAIVVWNEKTWVLTETLAFVDSVVHIPMQWIKASLNVGQAAAILMREVSK